MVKFAASEHLEKVTGTIFAISTVSDFIEASRIFLQDFLPKKTAKIGEKHQRSFKKYCFAILRSSNKYSSCDTIPLSRSTPALEIMNGVNKHYMYCI